MKYTVPITFRLKSPVEEAKEETLTVVDVMPQYPGGDRELLKFIAQSIKYPTDAQEAGVQGRVICSFVVDKKGNIVEPKIIRGDRSLFGCGSFASHRNDAPVDSRSSGRKGGPRLIYGAYYFPVTVK